MFTTIVRTRIAFGILLLFLVSMTMSCQELQYIVRGKTIDAQQLDTHVEKDQRNGRDYQKLVVGYSFMDKDTFRHEYADAPLDFPNASAPTVKIQYLPGWEHHSRLFGQTNNLWVWIFLADITAAVLWIVNAVKNPSLD